MIILLTYSVVLDTAKTYGFWVSRKSTIFATTKIPLICGGFRTYAKIKDF